MLSVLLHGRLVRDPRTGTGRTSKPYTTALVSVPTDDGGNLLVSAIAFNDTAAALAALGQGDAVSIAGDAKLSTWTKDGEERHGLSVTAHRILTAYARRKVQRAQPAESTADDLPFDDELTF